MLAHRSPASLRVVGAAKQPPQHRPSRALRSEAAEEEAKQQQRNANIGRDNLSAVSRSAHSVQIFVKTLTGKTIALDAVLDDDVAAFHRLVEECEGVPVDQQRLIFRAHLVLRLRGGADEATAEMGGVEGGGGGGAIASKEPRPDASVGGAATKQSGGIWTGGKWYKVRDATALWKDTPSGVRLFAAGGIAGACAKTAVAPLERIKMLLQVRTMQNDIIAKSGGTSGVTSSGGAMSKRVTSNTIIGTARSVLATDGVAGFWRGNFANTVRIVPTKGMVYVCRVCVLLSL
jgi:hypothetical protein